MLCKGLQKERSILADMLENIVHVRLNGAVIKEQWMGGDDGCQPPSYSQ